MNARSWTALAAAGALVGLTTVAEAGTALQDALDAGAQRLTSDEIAERIVGKTVTFVSASDSDYRVLVYYGLNNEAASSRIGGDTKNTGFYALTDRDRVCLGWEGRDLPRLRCLDVLLIDGVMHKFKADGSLSGRITETADGNMT